MEFKYSYIILFAFLILCIEHIIYGHGYQYGPLADRVKLYEEQYPVFLQSRHNASLIRKALLTGRPYLNVPQYPLTYRDVPFYLYTRKNPDIPQILFVGDSKRRLLEAGFNPRRNTVLYAHGLLETYLVAASNFTSNLLPEKDLNIFIITWDSYSFYDKIYSTAVIVIRLAKVIARFLLTLLSTGTDRKKIHLIGFSDGAEAVGLAGKQIYPRVARITVFDPAGGTFSYLPRAQRVSIHDADYVQIIHCSVSGIVLPPEVKGDVTFYMNGGIIQPQCAKYNDTSLIALCSHQTCVTYLYQSLKKNNSLLGVKCAGFLSSSPKDYDFSNKVLLTYDVPTNVKGSYCVNSQFINSTKALIGRGT